MGEGVPLERRGPSLVDALVPLAALGILIGGYASPLLSVLYGYTGLRIERVAPSGTAMEMT